ncbi:MAG: hypothetical protein E7062_10130 [Spirochaetaceae bacterium]|nr:hypothetical protein [Spirochaetaceae bacterium]
MKKIISVLLMGTFLAGSLFAMDLSIGLKGIVGTDKAELKGTDLGGGFDINLAKENGFGIQIESNIVPSKITSTTDGMTFTDSLLVNIPVMAWYNAQFGWFNLGLGCGISCTLSETHPENTSNAKIGLTAGLKTKFFLTDTIALVAGVTGNLDCLPNLVKTTKDNSSTYQFEASDFSRNALFGSLGVEYRFSF